MFWFLDQKLHNRISLLCATTVQHCLWSVSCQVSALVPDLVWWRHAFSSWCESSFSSKANKLRDLWCSSGFNLFCLWFHAYYYCYMNSFLFWYKLMFYTVPKKALCRRKTGYTLSHLWVSFHRVWTRRPMWFHYFSMLDAKQWKFPCRSALLLLPTDIYNWIAKSRKAMWDRASEVQFCSNT